jgi:hypothetical protein
MPARSNPFYTYQNPEIGQGFDGLAAIMTSSGGRQSSTAPRPPSPNAIALADKYRAETQGIITKNQALETPPAMLAELFMSGGKVADDPFERNPNYNPDQQVGLPADFDLTTPMPVAEYQPMFQSGRSAQEKMGMAIQEALVRGIKADEIAKLFAQGGYLANVNAGTPEAGMPYMPLFGSAPTTSTALTVDQQNKMSARDAGEAKAQAEAVARIQGVNSANVANINQAGQDRRFANKPPGSTGAGGRAPTIPAVTPATIKGMTNVVNERLKGLGFKDVDPRVVDGLVSVASQRYQDPNVAFKNPAAAVDTVLNDLNAGTLPGFESATQPGGFFSRDKKTLSRNAPAPAPAPATPAPATRPLKTAPAETMSKARDAIARGADRNTVIERMRQNGFDPKGL